MVVLDKINAETTAGGIAHWVTSLVASELRTNATDFRDSWTLYIDGIINATVPNQVSNGGPVIGKFCRAFIPCTWAITYIVV